MIKICLKTVAKQDSPQRHLVHIDTRLPVWIESPVDLNSQINVQAIDNYYLITLHVDGLIPITCQRCLSVFEHRYQQDSELVVCRHEDVAERLMARYEVIVAENLEVDLVDLVTDELYFSSPDKHPDLVVCNSLMTKI